MSCFNDFETVLNHQSANSVISTMIDVVIPFATSGREAIS
jgi:hypothetical protein